jgi:hypothetical protein
MILLLLMLSCVFSFDEYCNFKNEEERVKIDWGSIDKVELLFQLWTRQKIAGFFGPDYNIKFNKESAAIAIQNGYIDYFRGRAIKTDLRKPNPRIWLYERDAGQGKFEEAVAATIEAMKEKIKP